jgi:signal peptidase I
MSGSGSREGFGSPPWDPAEPVPEPEGAQPLPGLGTIPGQDGTSQHNGTSSPGSGSAREQTTGADGGSGPGGTGGPGAGVRRKTGQEPGPAQPSEGTAGRVAAEGDGAQSDGAKSSGGQRQNARPGRRRRRRRRSFWRELPVLIVVALVLALVIKTYAVQPFYIPSASMENTLNIGDRLLINKLVYDFRSIHRGDIIVFDGTGSWDFNQPPSNSNIFSRFFDDVEGIFGISHDSSIYVKRVIGVPGDHVRCCDVQGRVTVNGVPLNEQSYLYPGNAPSTVKFNITVPAGRLWVMGDHREVSYDSRGHIGDPGGGTIPESGVLGRAFVIIWPPSRWGVLSIPATFEQPQLNAPAAAAGAPGGSNAALAAAMDNGTPLRATASALPLALGFAGAIPLTWLQATIRRRLSARRTRRRGARS